MNNRIGWIDAAKGIGIFLVVFGHMYPPGLLTAIIWTFHMPLFFFLSGVTARSTTVDSIGSTLGGLRSIIYPYLFFSIGSIVVFSLTKGDFISLNMWASSLAQVVYGVSGDERFMQYNVPLWFLTCLLSVKLLFAILTMWASKKWIQILVAVVAVCIAHVFIHPHIRSIIWNLDVALSALVFYVLGFISKKFLVNAGRVATLSNGGLAVLAVIIVAFAVMINGRVDMNVRDFENPLIFYCGAISGIFLIVISSKALQNSVILKKMGIASIAIFSLHALFWLLPNAVTSALRWYAFKITRSDIASNAVVTAIEIAICMLAYSAMARWTPVLLGQTSRAGSASPASSTLNHAA